MPALSTIVAKVRDTIQDEDSDPSYRISDVKMTQYANDFVRELALLRPDLFSTIGDIACTAGTCLQSAPASAVVLMDIFQVKDGRVVTEGKRRDIDRFNQNWLNDTAAAAENWIRQEKDPLKFFIYPKAPDPQTLVGQWAQLPAEMADVDAQIPAQVQEVYYSAMHHYMVFRAEAKDDEAVLSNRAKLFYDGFATLVGAGKVTKKEAEKSEAANAQQVAQ